MKELSHKVPISISIKIHKTCKIVKDKTVKITISFRKSTPQIKILWRQNW